ncbi:MFS general substrate transporter [Hesseltinella vesiculosa]|uniref:MFS general substrate transporter n=1 Tax=Hesseltinella vesiculosa TaxID=101127 RepID=A0A1X2GWQ7_9FUNG|nr:MFS general substrate transporter [Hesseltinella vesiculosa]
MADATETNSLLHPHQKNYHATRAGQPAKTPTLTQFPAVHYEDYKDNLGSVSLSLLTFCLCTGAFLAALDTSIVSTIFNVIGTEFESANLAIWVITSYLLSSSAFQPTYAKLSTVFGRKTILIFILSSFLIGSAACGAAGSMVQMGLARAVAGIGGGGLMAMSSIVIHDLVPMEKRGQYQSYVNMAQTIGATVGAPLGGIINDTFGWRHCFYLNIPFCLFILYVYTWRLNNYNLAMGDHWFRNIGAKLSNIDYWGILFLFIGNSTFVVATSFGGNTMEWTDPWIVGLLVTSPIFFGLFVIHEIKWAAQPLVARDMMKNQNVLAVCANNFFLCNSTMTLNFLVPQFFMGVLGFPTSSAGLWVMPRSVMVAIGCWVAGRYLQKHGRYYKFTLAVILSQLVAAIATFAWKPDTHMAIKMGSLCVEGFAFGALFVVTMVALVADIQQKDAAAATSMIFLSRSSGWLTGGSISAAILQANLKANLLETITGPEADEIIEFVRTSITKIRTLPPDIQAVVIQALLRAIHSSLFYAVIASVITVVATLKLKDCDIREKKPLP